MLFQAFALSMIDIDEIILISSRVEQRASQSFNLTCWKSRQPRVYNLLSIFRQVSLNHFVTVLIMQFIKLTVCLFCNLSSLVDSLVLTVGTQDGWPILVTIYSSQGNKKKSDL